MLKYDILSKEEKFWTSKVQIEIKAYDLILKISHYKSETLSTVNFFGISGSWIPESHSS